MDFLSSLDIFIFHWINSTAIHPWLDVFFANITNLHREGWFSFGVIPLCVGLGVWFKGWGVLRAALVVLVTIGACDLINHRLIKPAVARERPFRVESVQALVKVENPPRGLSFPSNHALNMMVTALLLGAYFPALRMGLIIFAVLVGYSRSYLGVHYPSDILGGWLLAGLVVWLVIFGLQRFLPKWAPPRRSKSK